MKKQAHSVEVVFVMVLFSIFAILSIMLIFIGSDVYKRVIEDAQVNSDMRNSVSYLVNKIRANDRKDGIMVEEIDGISVLVLKEEDEGTVYKNLLYYYDGTVKEALTVEGMEFDLSFGESIMEANSLEFSYKEEEHAISMTIEDSSGNKRSTEIALRSGE